MFMQLTKCVIHSVGTLMANLFSKCDVSCENQTKCAFYNFEKNDHEHGTQTFNRVRVFYIS